MDDGPKMADDAPHAALQHSENPMLAQAQRHMNDTYSRFYLALQLALQTRLCNHTIAFRSDQQQRRPRACCMRRAIGYPDRQSMKRSTLQESRSRLALLVVAAVLLPSVHCSDVERLAFTADKDVAVMGQAMGVKKGNGYTVSLCEDAARAEQVQKDMVRDCQIEHVVRADGSGIEHSRSAPTTAAEGCTGCALESVGFVKGTISGPGLGGGLSVTGRVVFGDTYQQTPYQAPYRVELADKSGTQLFEGQIDENGRLTITRAADSIASIKQAALSASGAASCQ
jgi:hypothetical protein